MVNNPEIGVPRQDSDTDLLIAYVYTIKQSIRSTPESVHTIGQPPDFLLFATHYQAAGTSSA